MIIYPCEFCGNQLKEFDSSFIGYKIFCSEACFVAWRLKKEPSLKYTHYDCVIYMNSDSFKVTCHNPLPCHNSVVI